MFEAGKLYKGEYTERVIEVIGVGVAKVLVKMVRHGKTQELPIGHEFIIVADEYKNWHEYTPPIVHTEEIFVKWNEHSGFHVAEDPSCYHDTAGTFLRGKIRFTYTEGEPLKVEVL